MSTRVRGVASLWEFSNSPAGRVLRAIQLRGKATIKELAEDLGVTAPAVRLHIARLEERGAIRAEKVRKGVGRPHHAYSVTAEAQSLFYQDYADLTRILLEAVGDSEGPDALRSVLGLVGDRLASKYRFQVTGRNLGDRLQAWVDLMEERGVAVRVEAGGSGYVVKEYGCPYQSVALENRAVCEMERRVMIQLLDSKVRLLRCALDGEPGCEFDVTSKAPDDLGPEQRLKGA